MPVEVRTMISDLYHNRSRGFRGVGLLGTVAPLQTATLNGMFRVEQQATPITVTVGPGPDNFFNVVNAPLNTANAFYLFFHDAWSTVATITRQHRIAVGGGYSGCLYSVYHAGGGVYKCVHTARPSGTMSDEYVRGIRAYAAAQRWTLIHEVPTISDAHSGIGINGCVTTFLATRVSYTVQPNPTVRTVRLRQDSQGRSVGQFRVETPTP